MAHKFDKAGPGRPKGVPNKVTVQVKEAMLAAFDHLGGQANFNEWAKKNEDVYYGTLLPKLLPVQLNHADANGKKLQPTLNVFDSAVGLAAASQAEESAPEYSH